MFVEHLALLRNILETNLRYFVGIGIGIGIGCLRYELYELLSRLGHNGQQIINEN